MNLRGLLPSSFNEWEGRVAAVIFCGGCNWRCPYCHGARLVNDFATLPEIPPAQVFDLLAERRDWLDGVVITGGEPTLQPDLLDFIRELRALDLPVKLSTNGSRPAVVKTLLQENLLACLGFDYKAPLDERLAAASGADDVAAARESYALARAALKSGAAPEVEFHTTLCPQFIDRKIIAEMTEQLDGAGALWILQQYENDVEMLDATAAGAARYSREELDALAEIARRGAAQVLLRYGK